MAENKLLEKLEDLKAKYASLQEQLSDPELIADMKRFVQVNKEYKELEPIMAAGAEYRRQDSRSKGARAPDHRAGLRRTRTDAGTHVPGVRHRSDAFRFYCLSSPLLFVHPR